MTIIENRTMQSICSNLPEIAKQLERIADSMELKKCCICGEWFRGYGHNPFPLSDKGVCCDACSVKVSVERMKIAKAAADGSEVRK